MKTKTDKRLDKRAEKLIAERDALRAKVAKIVKDVTAKTNAKIVKFVRANFKSGQSDTAGAVAELLQMLADERALLDAMKEPAIAKKKRSR